MAGQGARLFRGCLGMRISRPLRWYNTDAFLSCTVATRRATPASPSPVPGTLYLVATPIGNLRDITLRALDLLKAVALIAAEDTRRTGKLLTHYGIRTRTLSYHSHNEQQRAPVILERLRTGDSVALVTDAGTPLVSDPGARLVRTSLEAGFSVEPIPGASALPAALAMSGFAENQFTFVGFPPSRSNERIGWLQSLRSEPRPLVFFESPHRIRQTLGDIIDIIGDLDISICREMTKIHEELIEGPISQVLDRLKEPKGEFTLILQAPAGASSTPVAAPSGADIAEEFGRIAKKYPSRRNAIKFIADKYGMKTRDVYALLEMAKQKLVE